MFGEYMGEPDRKYGLQYVLCLTDLEGFDEKEHNALSDAYNTALLFLGLETGSLKFNRHYRNAQQDDAEQSLTCTLGDLFGEMLTGCA